MIPMAIIWRWVRMEKSPVGQNYFPAYGETNASALTNFFVTAIAAGTEDSLALKSDGTVYAWGLGVYR